MQAVNNISKYVMSFKQTNQICSPLKLTNQSTLNKAYVIETTEARIVAFMKSRNSLVVRCRERKKKQKMVKIYFLKLLLIIDFG